MNDVLPHSTIGVTSADLSMISPLAGREERDDETALRAAAQQFESLFIQMLLESARDAGLQGDLPLLGERGGTYQQMYERELGGAIASSGQFGIADLIVEQFSGAGVSHVGNSREGGAATTGIGLSDPRVYRRASVPVDSSVVSSDDSVSTTRSTPLDFVRDLWPVASLAGKELGISPRAIVAHAALESGWGRSVPTSDSGLSSHNFFGIKADRGWSGAFVAKRTLEYEQGAMVSRVARFRAYDDVGSAVRDYVSFLRESPRYAEALTQTSDIKAFFDELQRAGYATDPAYSDKLMGLLNGSTLEDTLRSLKVEDRRPITSRADKPMGVAGA